jgi:DNA-binding winged helix-turn-helix (wHTH) protein
MDTLTADEILLFEGFCLDRRAGGLFRVDENGVLVPVAIGSRALDLLMLLVTRHGDLISKHEIMAAIWPGMIVEDSNLPTQISALRRVFDRGRSQGSFIQTVAGRGYRFVAPVTRTEGRAHSGRTLLLQLSERPLPRLSIIVLPFVNLGNDRAQQYFADGITDDLTTDLSRLPNMFVTRTIRHSPIETGGLTPSRSAASWVCATCWKEASGGQEAKSASTPS